MEKLEEPIEKHIPSDPIEYVYKVSLIEDNIEDPFHDIIIETIENLECSHDYFTDNDHIFSPYLPQEQTIIEAYKETYDKISMVCDDTRPCSPHVDEGLESLLPCNILSEEDCYEYKEDMDR